MTDQQPDTRGDYLDERDVLITAAGRARMRERIDELANRWPPSSGKSAGAHFLARLNNA
ncbi:hypothetical protein [Dactylosporangium darangshiense]